MRLPGILLSQLLILGALGLQFSGSGDGLLRSSHCATGTLPTEPAPGLHFKL